jgi:tetrathionate reductase subunit A
VLTNVDSLAAGDRSRWVPIKPGTDGALAMAMIRWIIEHERYDRHFAQPNLKVAEAAGEAAWCNATHLIIHEKANATAATCAAPDIGAVELAEEERYKDGDPFCVIDAATQAIVPHSAAKGEARCSSTARWTWPARRCT